MARNIADGVVVKCNQIKTQRRHLGFKIILEKHYVN